MVDEALLKRLIAVRRDLHQNPELPHPLQVLADLRKREPDGFRKLGWACLAVADQVEDLKPHGMRDRTQDRSDRFEDAHGQQGRRELRHPRIVASSVL